MITGINIKEFAVAAGILLMGLALVPGQSMAQWSIGASYEIRQEDPTSGFGARIERKILKRLPIVDLGLRAHFSYFSDENGVTSDDVSYGKIENYDFGLAAIGGASLGLVRPYVGLGLGSETFDIEYQDVQNAESDSKVYWNALVGAEVSPIPALTPFVEYRFQSVDEPEFAPGSSGRMIFGLSLHF